MSDSNSKEGGIGFCGLLTIVFIVLKLTHYIDWGWAWVLSPLWIPFVLIMSILLIYGVIYTLASIIGSLAQWYQARRNRPFQG